MLTWSDILDYLRIGWIFKSFNFNSLIRYKSLNFPQLFFFIYLQISNYHTHICEPSGTYVSSMHICERALFPLLSEEEYPAYSFCRWHIQYWLTARDVNWTDPKQSFCLCRLSILFLLDNIKRLGYFSGLCSYYFRRYSVHDSIE